MRYEQLKGMEARGLISGLEVQPSFPLVVHGVKIAVYRADFRYWWHGKDVRDPRGELRVEEVKGLETPEWKLKCKLMRALYPQFPLGIITLPRNKAEMAAEHGPQYVEAMVGKMSNFGEWIRLRWQDQVPE